jgi:hypothetical protein
MIKILNKIYMNKILAILSLLIMSCSNNASHEEANDESAHERHEAGARAATDLQLNNGAKWKADEATQKNVSALVKLLNDSSFIGEKNRVQLTQHLQTRIDTLVNQCRMKGPDHDTLHIWLARVLHDLKEVKEENDDYQKSFATLKKDVESFYTYFE